MTMAPKKPAFKNARSRSLNVFTDIEKQLIANGALDFSYELADQRRVAIRFALQVDGETIRYRMPARVERVQKILNTYATTDLQKRRAVEQAYQTAWATIRDWLGVQFALLRLTMTEPAEIFLAYQIVDGEKQTMYQLMREKKLLTRPRTITELPQGGV